jgi:predicted DNA-binding protein with PD1-like motif
MIQNSRNEMRARSTSNVTRLPLALLIAVVGVGAAPGLNAQQPATPPATAQQTAPRAPQPPLPEGYMPRGFRPAAGKAPGMKVTDLGKGGRTFRINLTKGDEIMSALVEFAEKYHIRNGHFTAVGALDKGTFGWTDVERGLGQKKIELNQEAEVVSLIGSISMDAQGRPTVHGHGSVALSDGSVVGGHWFEAHVSIIAEIFVTEEEAATETAK